MNERDSQIKDFAVTAARPEIRTLQPYDAGSAPAGVRLCANENDLPPSAKVREAIIKAAGNINRYPESSSYELRCRLAERYGPAAEQIVTGNGLDGIFTMIGRAFLSRGDTVLHGALTFSVYESTARIMGAEPISVPMTGDLALDVDSFISAVTPETKLICFCNPNNPTGSMAKRADIMRLLDTVPQHVLVLLDEAYIEFSDRDEESALNLLNRYRNLLVCRTFSKIHGLAGLRIGWLAADKELTAQLYKVREPYCVTEIAAAAAAAALDDSSYYENSKRVFTKERRRLEAFFKKQEIDFFPTEANFFLLPEHRLPIFELHSAAGITARKIEFAAQRYTRLSIGTAIENSRVMAALTKALACQPSRVKANI